MRNSLVRSAAAWRGVGLVLGAVLLTLGLRGGAATPRPTEYATVTIEVPRWRSGQAIDPARARGVTERLLARNLFGRLLEYGEDGELIPGLAATFEWRGRTLVLSFADRPGPAGGRAMTAAVAAASLRRTLALRARMSHSDLVLCPSGCIEVVDGELRLTPVKGVGGARLAALLASTEYGIVAAPGPLHQTTGVYRWAAPADGRTPQLRANLEAKAFDAAMPAVIRLRPGADRRVTVEPGWEASADADGREVEFWKLRRRR